MAAKTTDPIDILLEMGIDLDNLSDEEDYLSALMEATNALTIKDSRDPRIGVLQKEIKKERKKRFEKARPELKRKRVNPDNFFDRRQPERTTEARSNQEGSPIGSGQSVRPENLRMPKAEEGKIVKREPDVLKDILGGVISILETLKEQNKLGRERAEKDRKQSEKVKRSGKEDKLEKGPLEKFVGNAKKLVKPVSNLFEDLFNFIKTVIIGRLLFKIIGWFGDPKNAEKIAAMGDFFRATWPALLAAFVVFKLKLGGFIGLLVKTIAGFIPKLLGLIPKIFKGVVGLAKLAIANPIAASVIGGTVLTALGAVAANQPGSATVKDPDDPEKSQMDEINEAGGMRGAPMSLDMFSDLPEETSPAPKQESPQQLKGGGQVPGSGPNKDTVPAMLAPGEFVMSRGAVQKYGSDTFASMNAAGGGTNLPERMNGITHAVGGGEISDHVKSSDEKNDRPKVDNRQYSRNGKEISEQRFNAMLGMKDAVKEGGAKGAANYILDGADNMIGGLRGKINDTLSDPKSFVENNLGGTVVDGNVAKPGDPDYEMVMRAEQEREKILNQGGSRARTNNKKDKSGEKKSGGGFFDGIKNFFGGGKKEDTEEKKEGSSNLTETQQQALQVLAKYESGAAGYDAVNQYGTHGGRGVEGFSGDIKKMPQHKGKSLTDFTIAEIKQLQYDDGSMSKDQWIEAGKLHAVGAYQFIGNTLPAVAKKAGIPDSAKFTPGVQDLMALQLMKDRGINPWVGPSDKASAEERAIIERARTQPIAYDSTSGGGAIKSFGGGGVTYTASSGVGKSGRKSHTKTLSSIVGGVEGQMMKALGDAGSGGLFKSTSSSGSSIQPPTTTPLSTIQKRASGGSSSNQNAPTRPADPSPPNSIPPIDAEAMISQEKIKVLGIVVG